MSPMTKVNPGDPIQAHQLNQVLDALQGTPGAGVPIAMTQLNDQNNYALTVQNLDPTNSRAINVIKSDGTPLLVADASGLTIGAPLHVPGAVRIDGNLSIFGGSYAILFGDTSHYLQWSPAGATNILSWTHDFQAQGNLSTVGGNLLCGGAVHVRNQANTADADLYAANVYASSSLYLTDNTANHRISSSGNYLYFDEYTGWVWRLSSSGFATIMSLASNGSLSLGGASSALTCQAVSLTQGSNQVIYWRDASHYLQYAPSGATNVLAWTHDFQCQHLYVTDGSNGYVQAQNGDLYVRTAISGNTVRIDQSYLVLSANGASFGYGSPSATDRVLIVGQTSDSTRNAIRVLNSATGALMSVPCGGAAPFIYQAWTTSSSAAVKQHVEPIEGALDLVLKTRGVRFEYTPDTPADDAEHFGFIGEEMETVLPQVVQRNVGDVTIGITYTEIIPVLSEAIKELAQRVAILERN